MIYCIKKLLFDKNHLLVFKYLLNNSYVFNLSSIIEPMILHSSKSQFVSSLIDLDSIFNSHRRIHFIKILFN